VNQLNKLPRDLLVVFAFSALPIAGFLLAGTADTQFYVSLLTISIIGIFAFWTYYSNEVNEFLPFGHELESFSFVLILLGTIGCLFISSFLIRNFVGTSLTSLYVPKPAALLAIGSITLPPFWSDVLFTICLVATAEECSKLVTALGFYIWLKDAFGKTVSGIIGVAVPVVAWAFLHTYANPDYQGQYMPVYVGSAFISGLLIFYIMKKTKSLLAAILIHALYNISILIMLGIH
jgi:membrane protease YdiL (CAAX protease family)